MPSSILAPCLKTVRVSGRVAKELTPVKPEEAQRMVREWEKSHPRKGSQVFAPHPTHGPRHGVGVNKPGESSVNKGEAWNTMMVGNKQDRPGCHYGDRRDK